jgi:tetratricopeptide (TPR) repeat protein
MSTRPAQDPDDAALDRIETLLRRGPASAAAHEARAFIALRPQRFEGYALLGRAQQKQGDIAQALDCARAARQRAPGHPAVELLYVECLLQSGEYAQGLAILEQLTARAAGNVRLLQDVGQIHTNLNRHVEAEACYGEAAKLAPRDPAALYNWSTALTAVGKLDAAEQALDQVIALNPADADAYYNRSTLRRQTRERNHTAELAAQLQQPGISPAAQVPLGYALAKELEDLGDDAGAFSALRRAADTRRRALSYRVDSDERAMADIRRCFDAQYVQRHTAGQPDTRPVFIIGLPRSGTTLVDRILSNHSQIESRGESSDLGAAVMRLASPARDKHELIERAARIDPAAIGRAYCARLPTGHRAHLIDKTPVNYLYAGLIARALPNARLIHVRRRPMDVCYAMYKTLFRMAYPFSYDLIDIGRYYLAYSALMTHWRALLGSRLIEVDYEQLVAHQESATRQLLAESGWPWEDACLEFHKNQTPSLTASAAQVRQPIYHSSVGLWHRYADQLAPLAALLRDHGVAID